jgi:hypothetical protein
MKVLNVYSYIAVILIVSVVAVFLIGHQGIGTAKLAGLVLAALAVLPVFGLLMRAKKAVKTQQLLTIFVGGFLYKLFILLIGIWWATARAGMDTIDFAVSCLTFMIAFQISESLYFWASTKENGQS